MANRSALSWLANFLIELTSTQASRLVGIPCLYDVLLYHEQKDEPYPEDVLSLCKWIYARGQVVLNALIVNNTPPVDEGAGSDNDWQKVGIK